MVFQEGLLVFAGLVVFVKVDLVKLVREKTGGLPEMRLWKVDLVSKRYSCRR